MGKSSKYRLDLVLEEENQESRLIFYTTTREMTRLLAQWICACLDWPKFSMVQYVSVDDNYIQDASSLKLQEHNPYDVWRERMIKRTTSKLHLHVSGARNCATDLNLDFYFGSKEDMDIFSIYLKRALTGVTRDITCYIRKGNNWNPWVTSTLLREDYAVALYKLTPENINKVIAYSQELLAEQDGIPGMFARA